MSADCSISGQNSYNHYSPILRSLIGHLHGYKKKLLSSLFRLIRQIQFRNYCLLAALTQQQNLTCGNLTLPQSRVESGHAYWLMLSLAKFKTI